MKKFIIFIAETDRDDELVIYTKNIKLRYSSKGDDDMCNLSQGIYNDGFAEGINIGKAEGKAEGINIGKIEAKIEVVKNLLAKGFSLEEALTIADIDKETYEEYSAKEN